MRESYKVGTVETVRVCSTGRRFYVNLDRYTVEAFGIQAGDILKVKIEEGSRPSEKKEA